MKKPLFLPLASFFLLAGLCLLGCEQNSPAENKNYKVSFDLNGAAGSIATQTIAEGAKVAKPADPERDGYTFVGWYTDETTTQAYDFTTATVTANMTLYAKWAADAVETFTVSFNSNGGSSVESRTVTKDAKVDQPTAPEKEGYTFDGWYTDETTTQAYNFTTATVTANITLYAKWTADISDDIVFASLTDTTKTVIGMREFLLTVTYNNLTDKDSLVFIVGESATPPAWTAVENHPAKITRSFDNADKQTREVYFSLTEAFSDYIELSAVIDLSSGDEKEIARTKAPGIMTPATTYFVHVYGRGYYITTSLEVTTTDYPSAYPNTITQADFTDSNFLADPFRPDLDGTFQIGPYLWGMDPWRLAGGGLREIELREDENWYLPFRLIPPMPIPFSDCRTGSLFQLVLRETIASDRALKNQEIVPYPVSLQGGSLSTSTSRDLVVFSRKSGIPADYYDIMWANHSDKRLVLWKLTLTTNCFRVSGGGTPVNFYPGEHTIQPISE